MTWQMYTKTRPLHLPWRKGDFPPKGIPGFTDYFATPSGLILRYVVKGDYADVMMGGHRICQPIIHDKGGYLVVKIKPDGKRYGKYRIHRLVVTAFERKPMKHEHVAHLDGDPNNNSIYNLRICSATNNMKDRERHGRTVKGENINTSVLNAEKAQRIRRQHKVGIPIAELARRYGVHRNTIAKLLRGITWKES